MKALNILLACGLPLVAEDPIRGFPPQQWARQRELERRAVSVLDSKRIGDHIRRMSAQPHHAGSAGSRAVAEYALKLFRSWGYEARIETFEALLPYPKERLLEMVAPVRFRAQLEEPALKEDPDSTDRDQLPTYNAYSAAGDVTAPLVYVNYGLPEDYELLKKQGVDVRGKIVIARYGKSWRGTKPKVAAENGAAGCLIYSDPRDDGYWQGDVYPKGPFRPSQAVQRGSVMDMPLYVGDPLSPGWASEPGGKRLRMDEAATLMKIPVLPISHADARPLLEALEGPVAPDAWRGALPITYHIGPGPATVRLKLEFDFASRPVHNVIADIRGSEYPDQWVIYGNHHDAWVNGASDPASGAASLLETSRALGELAKQGWKPKRTLVFALWDAEEFGLVGSTEWVEKHLEELRRKAVVYLNSDTNGRGALGTSGSYALEMLVEQIVRELKDPVSGKSLLETGKSGKSENELRLSTLGAGSDYVAFVHHAGIASLNAGFSGGDSGGVYHSIYDSYEWYKRFGDGDFTYGKALSTFMGTMLLRLSEAPVVPFEFSRLARTIEEQIAELEKIAADAKLKLDFREVAQAQRRIGKAAAEYEKQSAALAERAGSASADVLGKVSEAIFQSERVLTRSEGLPGRPWYRHQITAPGLYTGYSARMMPGIREAIDAGRSGEAAAQTHALAQTIESLGAHIESLCRMMGEI